MIASIIDENNHAARIFSDLHPGEELCQKLLVYYCDYSLIHTLDRADRVVFGVVPKGVGVKQLRF